MNHDMYLLFILLALLAGFTILQLLLKIYQTKNITLQTQKWMSQCNNSHNSVQLIINCNEYTGHLKIQLK